MSGYSEVESRRFGWDVHRSFLERLENGVVTPIFEAAPDVAILRFPSEDLPQLKAFFPSEVFQPIVADTLVKYRTSLPAFRALPYQNNRLGFREAVPEDESFLGQFLQDIFWGYPNHYAANSLFEPKDILAGIKEWGMNLFANRSSERPFYLAILEGRPVAFAACVAHGDEFEVVLNGVSPQFRKRKIYSDLFSFVLGQAKKKYASFKITTQAQNTIVQRTWLRNGLLCEGTNNTVHLNLFLSDRNANKLSKEQVKRRDLVREWLQNS